MRATKGISVYVLFERGGLEYTKLHTVQMLCLTASDLGVRGLSKNRYPFRVSFRVIPSL